MSDSDDRSGLIPGRMSSGDEAAAAHARLHSSFLDVQATQATLFAMFREVEAGVGVSRQEVRASAVMATRKEEERHAANSGASDDGVSDSEDSSAAAASNASILRSFREVQAAFAGRTREEVRSAVLRSMAAVEAGAGVSREELRQYGCQPDADAEAQASTPQFPISTFICRGCLHGPYVATDNDEDANHDPDYDPPGISEEELQFHEAQFAKQNMQGPHTSATGEPVATPTESNSESSGGDSVADAAQRKYWQQQEEHHSRLRQQMKRDDNVCEPTGNAGKKASTAAGPQPRKDLGCQPVIDTGAPSDCFVEAPRCNRSCIFCTIERCGRRRGHNAHHNCESMRCLEAEERSVDVRSITARVEARQTSTSQAASSQDPAPSNFRPCRPGIPEYHVPPCLAASPLGSKLVQRMHSSDWKGLTEEDACKPLAPYELIKQERRLGLRGPKYDSCGYCGRTAAKYKCTTCWLTYYCDDRCQHQHWKQHKVNCVAPACQVVRNSAVALPDYDCFQLYKAHACQAGEQDYGVPEIVLLGERLFVSRFGDAMLSRTCKSLARHGRPSLLYITVLKENTPIP